MNMLKTRGLVITLSVIVVLSGIAVHNCFAGGGVNWKVTIDNPTEYEAEVDVFTRKNVAETIVTTLKKLGCEVKTHKHNGHIDVTYRCPKWRQLDLDTHAAAHKWESWLKEFQFQTEHKH